MRLYGIVFSMMLITSCGGGGDATATVGSGAAVTELEGAWKSSCSFRAATGLFENSVTTYSGNTFTSSGSLYKEASCSTIVSPFSLSGNFVIGSSVITNSGDNAKKIDLQVLKLLGQDVDQKIYDIFKIDGINLYHGLSDATNDGTTDAKRPVELELSFISVKV